MLFRKDNEKDEIKKNEYQHQDNEIPKKKVKKHKDKRDEVEK